MNGEVSREKRKSPFVMLPDGLHEDKRLVRLKRTGGFEYEGLFFHLCFMLHRFREDGLEASMPLDLNDEDSIQDLVFMLTPMEESRIIDAIKQMLSTGLLESFSIDGVWYICAPIMRDAVLNIKRLSQLQSERRKGRNRDEELKGSERPEEIDQDAAPLSFTEYQRAILNIEGLSMELVNSFYKDVVKKSPPGFITEENVVSHFQQWMKEKNRG